MIEFLLGVDGGGSGTRVLLSNPAGGILARASAGPSALGQGVDAAWRAIEAAARDAFAQAGYIPNWSRCALGAGLSGVNHLPWRDAFIASNPGFARLAIDGDAHTALLAAHGGQPGIMVAAGTGSVAEALYPDGSRRQIGGWGFPVGDEGSGAWLGLRAMAHTQQVMDGRAQGGALARAVQAHCGSDHAAVQAWCAGAGQFAYAQLAPLVFTHATHDAEADALLSDAATALECMALALDPDGALPLALCGSIGRTLQGRMTAATRARCVASEQEAAFGALTLIRQTLEHSV